MIKWIFEYLSSICVHYNVFDTGFENAAKISVDGFN